MNQTAAADPECRRRSAAPSQLDAAADDVSGIGPRRDVKQQPGEDEQPEFVNAEYLAHHFDHFLKESSIDPMHANLARTALLSLLDRASAGYSVLYYHWNYHWNQSPDHVTVST